MYSLRNIFLSLIFDSVLLSVIPFPHLRFNVLRLPSLPLKCALVYRKLLYRWSSNYWYVFIAKEIRQMCFTGMCYQRNYRQHTKVRSVRSNSLSHEAHVWNDFLACMTGALWAKRGERDISRGARHEDEARDEGKRKIKSTEVRVLLNF